jgi:ubiquinone/menaquinone biosynthesis C-methylase UbiE
MNSNEIKEAVKKSWDNSSGMYDTCPGHRIGTQEEEDAWMHELRQDIPPPPLLILDVGCGTGAMGLLYAKLGYQVTGVDLSEAMMNLARVKATERNLTIELKTGDAEHLPFEDESFDVIVNRHLLWTLPHPEKALKEWHRVLRAGGTLIIIDGVWNDKSIPARFKRGVSDGLTRIIERDNTHHRSYDKKLRGHLPHDGGVSKEVVQGYLESAGFSGGRFRDLMYIRLLQRDQLPWYRKITSGKSYYLLTASKRPE